MKVRRRSISKIVSYLVSALSVGRISASAPESFETCRRAKSSFTLNEQFPSPVRQIGGTCYGEVPVAALESVLYRETGKVHDLSTSFALCSFMGHLSDDEIHFRRARVRDADKEFVQGGGEQIMAQGLIKNTREFLAPSPAVDELFHKQIFPELTRLVKERKLSRTQLNCVVEKGLQLCRKIAEPVAIPEGLVKQFRVKTLREVNMMRVNNFAAKHYLDFVKQQIHPRTLEDAMMRFRAYLTPLAKRRWDALATPAQYSSFALAVTQKPSDFLATHKGLESLQSLDPAKYARIENTDIDYAESLLDRLFGVLPGTQAEETALGLMKKLKLNDFPSLLNNLKSTHAELVSGCEKAGAPFVRQALDYLCRGIPLMIGVQQAGVEYGARPGGKWKRASVGGAGMHAMVVTGIEVGSDGNHSLVFRNSWGDEKSEGRLKFSEACQIEELSVVLGPKDRARLNAQNKNGDEPSSSPSSGH